MDRTAVEDEANGMVVNLGSGRVDGGSGGRSTTSPRCQSCTWSQTRGDVEAVYWREHNRYLNDLEYDSYAWDQFNKDHDRRVSQLIMSQRFSNVSQK